MGKKLRGQNLSEYSVLIAMLLVAFVTINVYVRRGLQGRYRDMVNDTTAKAAELGGVAVKGQYEPYYLEAESIIDTSKTSVTKTMSDMDKGEIIEQGKVKKSLSAEPTTITSKSTDGINVEASKVIW